MKRYLTIIMLALSSGLFADVVAQERGNSAYRTSTWGLYAEGGATMVHGLGMSSVDAAPGMNIFPEIGAGVSFNIRPWIRLGLNYDFSKYAVSSGSLSSSLLRFLPGPELFPSGTAA